MPKQKKEKIKTFDELAEFILQQNDELAGIIARGVKGNIDAVAKHVEVLDQRITGLDRKMEAQYQDIMHALKPLTKQVPNLEADMTDHELRIKALERHAGIGKE